MRFRHLNLTLLKVAILVFLNFSSFIRLKVFIII